MKVLYAAALSLAFFSVATAETRLWATWVNGVDQGEGAGIYIRSSTNAPVKDLWSNDMRCGIGGNIVVPASLKVKAGDKLDLEWHRDNRTNSDIIIDPEQRGPIQLYMAPAGSNGSGNVWVKILSAAYSSSYRKWGTEALLDKRGRATIWVPNVPAGKYLLRPEILALHEADELYGRNPDRGIQVYTSCIQIEVTSSGPYTLPSGIPFPGAYTGCTPGITWDLRWDPATYKAAGGDLWSQHASGLRVPQDPTKPPSSNVFHKPAPAPLRTN
ncbi:hypothetical protein FRC02_000684 [Tulasnella sp. 418]|nr:hypothetical protein FRC02_000684 [Tulasnella sp. 418]